LGALDAATHKVCFEKNWSLLWLLSAIFGLNLPHLNSDATKNECSTESSQSMKVNLNKNAWLVE